jgi:hypothetical protein
MAPDHAYASVRHCTHDAPQHFATAAHFPPGDQPVAIEATLATAHTSVTAKSNFRTDRVTNWSCTSSAAEAKSQQAPKNSTAHPNPWPVWFGESTIAKTPHERIA